MEYDARGDRHKAWRDFTREATFQVYKEWPFDEVGRLCCTWSNISKDTEVMG